ncbi:MAG: hypothetical protein IJV71_06480 [Lachnospiraceae bacterium]|nr:hypothetical protein [Lachnospiraceae bacterium]
MNKLINGKVLKVVLPNMIIVGTLMLITLMILDYYNPLMGFLNRDMSVVFLVIYSLLWIVFFVFIVLRLLAKSKKQDNIGQ